MKKLIVISLSGMFLLTGCGKDDSNKEVKNDYSSNIVYIKDPKMLIDSFGYDKSISPSLSSKVVSNMFRVNSPDNIKVREIDRVLTTTGSMGYSYSQTEMKLRDGEVVTTGRELYEGRAHDIKEKVAKIDGFGGITKKEGYSYKTINTLPGGGYLVVSTKDSSFEDEAKRAKVSLEIAKRNLPQRLSHTLYFLDKDYKITKIIDDNIYTSDLDKPTNANLAVFERKDVKTYIYK